MSINYKYILHLPHKLRRNKQNIKAPNPMPDTLKELIKNYFIFN